VILIFNFASPLSDSNAIYRVTWGNGVFVAVGDDGKIATSPDGNTWTAVVQAPFHDRTQVRAVIYDGTKFVFASNRYTGNSYQIALWPAAIKV
jgi:hypothetical protein